jgi:predicted dithiol-disulfide oxidoreductase (DUF899 family)
MILGEIIMAELTVKNAIEDHQVVSNAEWLAVRKELLRKEKAFTRQWKRIIFSMAHPAKRRWRNFLAARAS